jgi:response regulator RpfG family c-di-GMP phosphodiesterase
VEAAVAQLEFNVLYVDDEVNLLSAFQRVFKNDSFNVTTTHDAELALELARTKQFHVIASDYRMPVLDGIEFLERTRETSPDSLRILITGMCDFDAAVEAINRGKVYRFIGKPWNNDDLRTSIHQALEYWRLKRENERLAELIQARNRELEELNYNLERVVQKRTIDVLNGLVSALDLRDTETQNHSRRVSLYAVLVAERMGVSGTELLDVERGALLHDVGKIGVRDSILLKPSKLTDEEWVEMKLHPELGYRVLDGIEFLERAREVVLHHQERFDGGGYPLGLRGEAICLGARIFSVVDTLDAMTCDRPYRKALPYEAARAEIERCSGTQFDPKVVEAFLEIPKADFERIKQRLADE